MPKDTKQSFEQLNILQRGKIEMLLKVMKSLQDIAKELGVSRQTIYREIVRNSYYVAHDVPGHFFSCVNIMECIRKGKRCFRDCDNYKKGIYCETLKRFPFVCNFCSKRKRCNKHQRFYDTETASNKYHLKIQEAHSFYRIDNDAFEKIKDDIVNLLKKGQSPEVIIMNHPEYNVSALTIRHWIKKQRLENCSTSLRLFGRRSKNYDYSKRHDATKLSEIKLGHRYHDYLAFIADHENALIVQFDTVMGGSNDVKSVLTVHIVKYKFQFGILLDKHSPDVVNNKLKELLTKLKIIEMRTSVACYTQFVRCWLADNGVEFDRMIELEQVYSNLHVFYTRTYSSADKGSCEKNHVLVRYIQYKGHSWDDMDQEKINLIFSHINSYPRKSLKKKTPYDLVLENLGQEFLDVIGITRVEKDDVVLNPSLIKKK